MKEKLVIPAALEIERAVLGAIIIENDSFDKIIELIRQPEVFYSESNQIIFSTMFRMYNSGLPIDTVTLYEGLRKEGRLEAIGGTCYLSALSSNISSAANIEYHAKILLDKWLLREMLIVAQNTIKQITSGSGDSFEIHSSSLNEFEGILDKLDLVAEDKTLWDDFKSTLDDIEKRYSGNKGSGLMSKTFPSLNRFTGGIRETDYIGILGDYKQGKSFLAQQIILDLGIYNKLPVGIFSLEMNKQALYHRAFSLRTGIDYSKLRNPKESGLTSDEFQAFIKKAEKIFKETKIYINDKILDKNRIKAKMKLWKRKYKIKMFVVDYLNLVELSANEKKDQRYLEISTLSRFFKNTATELEVPIIVLSQVNDKGIAAESKALMRDADFLISVKKPIEAGIKNIRVNGDVFTFDENHFLVTIENSRHGKNGFNFVAGFVNNNFVELDISNSHHGNTEFTPGKQTPHKYNSNSVEPVSSYYEYEKEEEII